MNSFGRLGWASVLLGVDGVVVVVAVTRLAIPQMKAPLLPCTRPEHMGAAMGAGAGAGGLVALPMVRQPWGQWRRRCLGGNLESCGLGACECRRWWTPRARPVSLSKAFCAACPSGPSSDPSTASETESEKREELHRAGPSDRDRDPPNRGEESRRRPIGGRGRGPPPVPRPTSRYNSSSISSGIRELGVMYVGPKEKIVVT